MKHTHFLFLYIILGILFSQQLVAREYKVAVRAHKGVEIAHSHWQATIDVLNDKIPEHRFTLTPIIDLDEITQAAGRNEYDFVLTNPSSYVELNILHEARALVTLNNRRGNTGQTHFGSVIFTHAKNEHILTLHDLKNTTVMAVSEFAFGGWRVGWLEMLEQGIDPYEDLKLLKFAPGKTQPEVVFAVLEGQADVGVVRTDQLERMANAGQIDLRYFRVLNSKDTKGFPFFHSTLLYPEWSFSAMPSVSDEIGKHVQQVLLAIPQDSFAASMGKYVGWVAPLDYTPVVQLMKRLRVGPYATK